MSLNISVLGLFSRLHAYLIKVVRDPLCHIRLSQYGAANRETFDLVHFSLKQINFVDNESF